MRLGLSDSTLEEQGLRGVLTLSPCLSIRGCLVKSKRTIILVITEERGKGYETDRTYREGSDSTGGN